MKTKFIPIDYDYFDINGNNFIKIIGRNDEGKRVCVIDSCDVYLWAILKDNVSVKKTSKIIEKISKIKLNVKGRNTKVERVEQQNKKFLEKPVNALKIYATNYKDLHDIADKLDFKEIDKRRGYDLGYITHYIIEKKIYPLQSYEISGELISGDDFGGIAKALDVDYCLRLVSSKEIKNNFFKPKTLAYDIETDSVKLGEGEILMISLVSDNFKKVITWKKSDSKNEQDFVEIVNNEAELIEKFVDYIKEISPDFLVGYFSDGFDLPYLKARAEKHRVKLALGLDDSIPKFSRGNELRGKINGIIHLDILKFIRTSYSQYMKSETLSLNEVSKEFLGDSKKEFNFKHSSEINDNEWNKYYEYNLHDSVLTYNLFEKFFPDLIEFTRIIKEPVYDVSRNGLSKQVENYVIHNLERFNEIPEKRPTYNEINERRSKRVQGAFVFEPTPGLYKDISIFDFTSMHTSIIISMNLSRGTLLNKKTENSYETPEIEIGDKKRDFIFQKNLVFFLY
ncbi:MAG: 3'-5' exonuclease [Minisyncoccales bacterium]